jgi:16S rRNA (cytosine967-C5)-methyltransferase
MMTTRPIDARRLAAEVIRRVMTDGAFAAAALSAELDACPQLAARDRGFATELVYGTLRAARWLEGEVGKHADRGLAGLDELVLAHLLLAGYQIAFLGGVPARAAVSEAVTAVKEARGARMGGFVNAVLRKLSSAAAVAAPGAPAPMTPTQAFVLGSPRWLRRALDRALGPGEGEAFLGAGPVPAPLSLRVRAGERDAWAARLAEAIPGATVSIGKASPACLLVAGGGDPRAWPGVADGELVLQEEGSQVVGLSLGARPGERVLDACAGRGNKSLLLSDAVGPSGLVDCADLHGQKLERLVIEAARVGAPIGATFEVDWSAGPGEVPLEAYDRVLVDAPCSGTGTLRRRPEILLRRAEADLVELAALQRAILGNAARAVKPGGTLVYAVCSVLREELEAVAGEGALPAGFTLEETRRLTPHHDGTDGYGFVRMVRRPA